MLGAIDMSGSEVEDSTGALSLGDACVTGHSLLSGDVCMPSELEVQGDVYFDGNLQMQANRAIATHQIAADTGDATDAVRYASPLRFYRIEDAAPAEPFACDGSGDAGSTVYVDDTNDGAASYLCFCGRDGSNTRDWLRVDDPSTPCPAF